MDAFDINEARSIVATIPVAARTKLRRAHARFKRFAGVEQAGRNAEEVAADRTRLPNLLRYTLDDDGKMTPLVSSRRCGEFMVEVTGLSLTWCLAWDEVDFSSSEPPRPPRRQPHAQPGGLRRSGVSTGHASLRG